MNWSAWDIDETRLLSMSILVVFATIRRENHYLLVVDSRVGASVSLEVDILTFRT